MSKLRLINFIIMGILILAFFGILAYIGFDEVEEVFRLASLIAGIILIIYLVLAIFIPKEKQNGFITFSRWLNIVIFVLFALGMLVTFANPGVGGAIAMAFTLVISAVLVGISFILFLIGWKKN